MITPVFRGKVENNKMVFDHRDRFDEYLILLEGKRVRLTVGKEEDERTLSQNALYWAYLHIVAQETGNGPDDLHEYFKRAHLTPKFITVMGKEIKIPQSTRNLTKAAFSDYMTAIQAETNVPLPLEGTWDYDI